MRTDLLETYSQIENAIAEIRLLPDIIQTLIDALHLDQTTPPTESQALDIGLRKGQIHSVLAAAQYRIWDTLSQLEKIFEDAGADPDTADAAGRDLEQLAHDFALDLEPVKELSENERARLRELAEDVTIGKDIEHPDKLFSLVEFGLRTGYDIGLSHARDVFKIPRPDEDFQSLIDEVSVLESADHTGNELAMIREISKQPGAKDPCGTHHLIDYSFRCGFDIGLNRGYELGINEAPASEDPEKKEKTDLSALRNCLSATDTEPEDLQTLGSGEPLSVHEIGQILENRKVISITATIFDKESLLCRANVDRPMYPYHRINILFLDKNEKRTWLKIQPIEHHIRACDAMNEDDYITEPALIAWCVEDKDSDELLREQEARGGLSKKEFADKQLKEYLESLDKKGDRNGED